MEELSQENDSQPLLSSTAKNIISATAISTTSAIMVAPLISDTLPLGIETVPLAVGTAIVMVKHHIAIALLSISFHRKKVHNSLELNPKFEKMADEIVMGHTVIDPPSWVSSHNQHHKYADKVHDKDSPKMLDTHPPAVLGERSVERLLVQWLKPSSKKYYMQSTDWLEENTTHRDNGTQPEHHIPASNVDLRGRKSLGRRLIPGLTEYSVYLSTLGPGYVAYMLTLQLLLGSGAITAINGGGHSAPHKNPQGNYAQNITTNGKKIGEKVWNALLAYFTAGEEHHGNHHKNMKSADITLGDPNQFDISYWYIKNILEPLGLAWNVKASTQNAKNQIKDTI